MGLRQERGVHGGSASQEGGLPPGALVSARLPGEGRSVQEIVGAMPLARLASIAGCKGWTLRLEERFPGGRLGPEREAVMTLTGPGMELKSRAFAGVRPVVFETLAADQILRQLPAAGQGGPVEGGVFSAQFGHRLLGICASLQLPRPRVELVSGNPEQLRMHLSQCFMVVRGVVVQGSGSGRSLSDAYRSAASKLLADTQVQSAIRVGSETDPTTALVGAARRAGLPKPQFLLHAVLQPIGVAVVLAVPGSEPLRFLGHADTLQHAREVAASRAYYWVSHHTKSIRRAAREAAQGSTEH